MMSYPVSIPVIAPGEDFSGMPEVGGGEVFFAEGLQDVEDDERARFLEINDDPVPGVSPIVVDHPGPAVIEVGEAEKVDFLRPDLSVGSGVPEEIEKALAGHGGRDAVAGFAGFLAEKDFLGSDAQPVVEVVLAEGAERPAGHVVPVASVMEEDRSAGHEKGDGVFVGVAVGHLFLFDRNGVAEIVAEIQAAVAFVAVIQEEIDGFGLPAVAKDDLLALDVLHDFLGQRVGNAGGGRRRPNGRRREACSPGRRSSAWRSR